MALAAAGLGAGTASAASVTAKLRPGIEPAALASWLDEAGWSRSVLSPSPLFRCGPARQDLAARHGLDRWVRLPLRPGADPARIAADLRAITPLFETVEVPTHLEPGEDGPPLPNDPNFGLQYGMHNTGQVIQGFVGVADADADLPEAWALDASVGLGEPVIVGIVDGGVYPHVEFVDRLLPGWNVIAQNENVTDVCQSHGTHVSGIVAARRDNALGVAGVNDRALLLPVRIFDQGCSGEWADLAEGLVWAVDHGAQIINASVHGYDYDPVIDDALGYCHDAGVLVVAIAGNNHAVVAYPGALEHALAVAATTNADQRALFSNPGPEVDVSAAGSIVQSTISTSGYAYKSGTSMAAPLVTGLGSILLSHAPWLDPDVLWGLMRDSADDVDAPGFDENTGWGRINAHAALADLFGRMGQGDLDADGTVGARDCAILLGRWGQPGAGDLDGDGQVGAADLSLLLEAWGG